MPILHSYHGLANPFLQIFDSGLNQQRVSGCSGILLGQKTQRKTRPFRDTPKTKKIKSRHFHTLENDYLRT